MVLPPSTWREIQSRASTLGLVAELSADDQTEIPSALMMLDYYGRELELGIAERDQVKLKRTAVDLQQTWNRFERTILQRGAIDEARRVAS